MKIARGLGRCIPLTLIVLGGPALLICGCTSLAEASVSLFISDGDVIHRFDAATGAPILPDVSFGPGVGAVTGLAIGPNGDLFAAATIPAPEIYRFDAVTGTQIGPGPVVTFNGQNDGHDVFNPQGMEFGASSNLYVADITNSDVHIYDAAGNSLGALTSADLVQPTDVAFDAGGNLYVTSGMANVLYSVGGTQPLTPFFAPTDGGLSNPLALDFGPDAKLYVLDIGGAAPAIRRYTAGGAADGTVVSYASILFQPNYLEFGPDGKLYVSGIDLDLGSGQVNRYLPDGTPDGTFIAAGLTNPTFMVFQGVPEPATWVVMSMVTIATVLMAWRKGLL